MKQLWFILIFVVVTAGISVGQESMQIKYEIGIANTIYNFSNLQENVEVSNTDHVYYGLTASHIIKKWIHVELGIY